MKKFFTLFAVAAMAFAVQANEWVAADGTATGEFAPVYGYNFETDQHNQMQYPAAELTGLAAGTEITAVKFYTSTPDLVNGLGSTVTVSLGNMDDVTPWEADLWGDVSGNLLDVEVTAVATVTPAADADGVWTITFDVPFTYTGGALLIDVQTVAGTYQSTAFYGKEMGSYLVITNYGYTGTTKKGQTMLPKAAFTYEGGGEEPGITTLAQANDLADNAEFTFNGDAVVTLFTTYQNINYLFVRDESGYGQLYDVDGTFTNGQVLKKGWNATKTSNDGWVKYIDATGLTTNGTNAELAAAQKLTGAVDESMLNAYVYIENVKLGPFPPRTFTLPDGSTISKSEILGGANWSMGGNYNVYGIIVKDGGALKFNALTCTEYVEPQGLRGDVDDDGEVAIADVSALIDYLLGNDVDPFNAENANCDLDNEIGIADVSALIDYLLNNTWD